MLGFGWDRGVIKAEPGFGGGGRGVVTGYSNRRDTLRVTVYSEAADGARGYHEMRPTTEDEIRAYPQPLADYRGGLR